MKPRRCSIVSQPLSIQMSRLLPERRRLRTFCRFVGLRRLSTSTPLQVSAPGLPAMAEHVFSVLCDRAIVDGNTGKISIIDVIEKITIFQKAGGDLADRTRDRIYLGHELGYLVSWWVRSNYSTPEVLIVRPRIVLPTGDDAILDPYPIDLSNTTGSKGIYKIPFVLWAGVGLYWLLVEELASEGQWRTAARLPLEIDLRDQAVVERSLVPTVPAPPHEPKTVPSRKPKPARRAGKRRTSGKRNSSL